MEIHEMFVIAKPGDLFVYRSKYGGVVRGEIARITPIKIFEPEAKAFLKCYNVISTTGVQYDFNEIELVDSFIPDDQLTKLNAFWNEYSNK